MLNHLRLGPRLVLILTVISVVPLLVTSIYNFHFAKKELEKKTISALQGVVDSRASHINHSIQLRQEQAKEFAGAYLLRQLKETGANEPELIQGIQNDIDSTFLDLNSDPTSRYQHIDKLTDIEIIGVWDVHGTIIANTNRDLIGRKMPLEYMQDVYEQGTYFRGFEKDPLTGKDFLVHLEEIRNWDTGNIVGALSLNIRARILDEITTAREGLGASGETYLLNNQYYLITPSRFISDSVLKTRVTSEGARACFDGRRAPTIYRNYRGAEVLGVQKYLPDQGWCLMAEIEAAEAFATVQALRSRTLAIGGLMILIILLFANLASRSFIRPILNLHQAAQAVSRGQYDVAVEVESRDEIGGLTETFNEMTKSLAKAKSELEEKSKVLFKHLAISTRQKKELKEVNQELDSFVYTASHDLRAPLRGIASFASFLEEDYLNKLDEKGRDYINEIRRGANKMNKLIEDLLQLSRISRIKNPYEEVSIQDLISSVRERLKFDIQKNQAELTVPDNLPKVSCDRIKMEEVFLNLVNNAIKFSAKNNPGHPKVEIGYCEDPQDHRFWVKDNGIGIDPKYHKQIFGIFKRLHTDKEYEGTGAGLSIIKRVIDDHHGRIWIESEPGKGATFFFTVPKGLKNEAEDDRDDTAAPDGETGETRPPAA